MRRIASIFLLALLLGGLFASGAHATVSRGLDCAQCHSFSNQRPVANAGADQTVNAGAAVTLNGSSSSDADDGIASYAWSQTAGTAVTITNATSSSARFTAPTVSTQLTFQLTVRDRFNQASTDTVLVTVNAAGANRPPTANAGADMTATSGGRVTLTGSGSDPDGNPITYAWTQTAGAPTVALSGASAASASFTAPTVSTELTFQLVVRDSGNLSATDTIRVTVRPSGPTPTGKPPLANAGLDTMVLPGTFTHLEGFYSSDPDDGIASYAWEQTGGPAVKLSDPAAKDPIFQAPSSPATLTFKLVVTDKGGLHSSDTCTVVVLSP